MEILKKKKKREKGKKDEESGEIRKKINRKKEIGIYRNVIENIMEPKMGLEYQKPRKDGPNMYTYVI